MEILGIENGGDFRFENTNDLHPTSETLFLRVHAWNFGWSNFNACVRTVQRFDTHKNPQMQTRKPRSFRSEKMEGIPGFGAAMKHLSMDITDLIFEALYTPSDIHEKFTVRLVETKSAE